MKQKLLIILVLCAVAVCGLCGCGSTEKYDVIVVGGDPEGISAAVTAARNGLKTLLVEDDEALGGLMTLGGLNFIDMCTGDDGTLLTRGTFKEFYDAVGGTAFDISTAKDVFLQMVEAEENLTLKLNTKFVEPIMNENTIVGVVLEENGEQIACKAKSVIDATVDADVAAAAGAPYTYLGEDYGHTENVTGVTLVFEVSGLNWPEIQSYLNGDDNPNTGCTAKAAWGYNEESFAYVPQDPQTRLRGLNIALQDNGNALINGFIIFGVEPLTDVSKFAGIQRGKAELEYIIPYLREHYKGFENVALVDTASQLYVRESRHILGEYQLTLDDVMENRWFEDTIAIGSYPVDVPPNAKRKVGYIVGAPDRYGVPFRALVPQEIDGMLVVGRSASYTSLAAGSARVIPLGMAEGDAAGVAAAYAKEHKMSFREISKDINAVNSIQQSLREQGAYLTQWEPIVMDVEKHWAYNGVKTLRSLGLLYGGYANDYRLDDAVSSTDLDEIVPGLMLTLNVDTVDGIGYTAQPDGTVAAADVLRAAAMLAGLDADNAKTVLMDAGILTAELQPYFADDAKVPNRAEVIMLLANVYQRQAENEAQAGEHYDVIVVGGDPEGVCAAVSSARNGLKTLLIEDDEALGGLMTLGKLNFIDICESRDGSILTQGLFMEFYDAVGGTAFDVETAKQFFYDWVVNEKNATLKLNTAFVEPIMEGNTITGVIVNENGKNITYTGDRIIDATVDADVAAASGVPYTVAGEDIGEKERQMGVTLVFELSGVNWDTVVDYLENDDNAGTGATDKTAWGYTREGYAYEPKDELMRLRGFNAARQDNGNVLINALIIFGVDAMSEESKAEGIARA